MAAASFFARGAGVIRRHRIVAIVCASVVGLLAAVLLFIWLILPAIVTSQAEAFVHTRGGDRLTIGRLSIVPLFEPRVEIDDLHLTQADGSPLLAFKQLSVSLSLASITRRALVIDAITLDGPQAAVTLLPKGALNWDALIAAPAPKPGTPAPAAAAGSGGSGAPGILIRKFALTDGQVDLADKRTATVQSVQIAPLAITLSDLSTLPADQKGAYTLTAKSSLGAEIDWSGTVSLTPLSVAGNFRLAALSLAKLSALVPLPPKLAPPQGTVNLATRYDAGIIDGKFDFQLADLALAVDGLKIAGKQSPEAFFALGHAGVSGGQFDWRRQQVAIQAVTLTGGGVSATRLADGTIDLLDLLPTSPAAASPPPAAAKPAQPKPKPIAAPKVTTSLAAAPANVWHYRVDRFSLSGLGAEFRDRTVEPPLDVALQDVTAQVTGISENMATPLPAHLALKLRSGGSVAVDGTLVPQAPSADLKIKIDGLALAPIQPYLASATILKLVGGTVSAAGEARYAGGSGTYAGGFAVENLRIMEGDERRPFLAWKSLATDNLTASPAAVDIKTLTLDGLDTALTVAKDRTVNVTQILKAQPQPKHKPGAHPAAAPRPAQSATKTAAAPVPVIHIARFRIRHGELDYADQSLFLPFATHVHDLNGTIGNISTKPDSGPARLDLRGRVDAYGTASAAGRFDLLAPTDLLDIDVAFDNIELTNLTPYLATFAGRRIDSGTLTLNLQYKIHHGQLAGDNRVILDQFTLGGRVRSPEARDLPLDLAIALLKDSHGRIDLGIPISGSLSDPQFSYGKLIWKVVSNLLTKIVTSPFRAIGSLFGGGHGGGGDNVTFAAGQSIVTPSAQKALAQLAASLESRPNLGVTIHGTWSEADRVALKEQKLRRALADRLDLPADADLSGITADKPDVQPALEDLYADRYGGAALRALKDGYRQSNAGKLDESLGDKVLSLVTGLFGKAPSLSAGDIAGMKGLDFHALLYQRLRDAEAVPDASLLALASARGAAAVAALHDARVPPERVILQPVEKVAAIGHDVPLTMGLGPATPPGPTTN
jgi:hypothetical protein